MTRQIRLFLKMLVVSSVLLLSACVSDVPTPVSTAHSSSVMPIASLADCQQALFLVTNLNLPENERNYLIIY